MANIKSAEKRIGVTAKKTEQNKSKKSEINTFAKKYKEAIARKELELAAELLKKVTSLVDVAATGNVIHKNKANRMKAKFSKMLVLAKGVSTSKK